MTAEDMTLEIARRVRDAGGRVLLVGGYVRDRLMGIASKDIDIEVYGITPAALRALLSGLGEPYDKGAAFCVLGLRHYDLDIAMPRSEKATGRGHKDFEVFVDPFIGEERAARRRDFTMNALMQDVLTGEILDFFGGRADIAAGRIRHVSDATYAEDPLRVFRAAQFAARFGFTVADETTAISAGMAVEALASERVMGELEKALLKSARPSIFFRELEKMKQLRPWFAEPAALPQADWRRVMAGLDAAAALRPEASRPVDFMLAATCVGFDPPTAKRFLARLTNAVEATRYVLNLVERHGEMGGFLAADPGEAGWMVFFDRTECPEDLILLERAIRGDGTPGWPGIEDRLRNWLALYRRRMSQPYVMGRDLVEAGLRPGPDMGRALAHAHGLRLAGADKAEQLRQALAWIGEERKDDA